LTANVVAELMKRESDPNLRKIWAVLYEYLIPSAIYYLHDAVNGGMNDKWQGLLTHVRRKDILREDLLIYLEEKCYGSSAENTERV